MALTRPHYLLHSNYNACLGNELVIASYLSKVVLGTTESDKTNQCHFNSKSLIIPADRLFQFVSTIKKGHKALQSQSQEAFEDVIWTIGSRYKLVGNYCEYEDRWRFSLRMVWNWSKDKAFLDKVSKGLAQPMDNKPDWVYLRGRGYTLTVEQVDNLQGVLNNVLTNAFFDSDGTKEEIHRLINFTLQKENLWTFVKEQLDKYPTMNHSQRMDVLKHLVVEMQTSENDISRDDFTIKSIMDNLSNKLILIFCLFNNLAS